MEAGAGTKKVEMFGDLACGWSQVAWRWLSAVADDRGLDVAIRPFSLLLRDGIEGRTPQQIARRSASLRALRVLTGLDQGDAQRFWDAVAQQDGPVPFTDLAGAMEAAGGPADAVAHADDEQRDRMIVEAMAHVERLIGPAPKIPVLVIGERVAFTGPILREPPDGDDAVRLWDALSVLASTPGFYEISRPRPGHPAVAGLPPTPVPPTL